MTQSALEKRLEHLEKQNRRIKLAGVAGLLGVAAILSMGQVIIDPSRVTLPPPPAASSAVEQVLAQRLTIVDAAGNAVATLDAQGLTLFQGSMSTAILSHGELWLTGDNSAAKLSALTRQASMDLMEGGGSGGFMRKVSITYSSETGPGIELHR